jgi:arylsulfatase B
MTGKYPHQVGMHNFVIQPQEPWGLSKEEKIMPQYFKEAGYTTRLIGKWHLGFYQKGYTPVRRGYDSFFGYLGAAIDYYDYTWRSFNTNISRGYDFRRDLDVYRDTNSTYATELFTAEAVNVIKNHDSNTPLYLQVNHLAPHAGNEDKPMQAKDEDIQKFLHIKNEKRRILAGTVLSSTGT